MSVAGSCFLQWTQKILTINKKLSRYIPPYLLPAISSFFFFESSIRFLIVCYEVITYVIARTFPFFFLLCVRNIIIARSVIDFSANTSTRHTRLLAMKADLILEDLLYLVFAIKRKEDRSQRERE